MTPTRRRNYQRRFGRAQRTLDALGQGLVRPEQLDRTPSQLQRTVQRYTANPIITLGKFNPQTESAPPRVSVFDRMTAQSSTSAGKNITSSTDRLDAYSVQNFKGSEATTAATENLTPAKPREALKANKPDFKRSSASLAKPAAKMQWKPKMVRSEVVKASANKSPTVQSAEPIKSTCEPAPEVPLVPSLEIKDVFDVAVVRQQMIDDESNDVPENEPGLDLELEDDADEGGSVDGLDRDDSNTVECDMVYVLSAKFALPISADACQALEVEGDDESQLVAKEEETTFQIEVDSALKKLFMMFSKPNLAMSMHLRPLYATVAVEEKDINKMMVDSGAAVNVITVRTMTVLGIKKSAIQKTTLSVKNFAGTTTQTLGLLFLKVKLGPADAVHAFFVVECTAPYSGILGRDWIHRSYCVPSSMHQELLLWNPITDEAELFKADPRPFSVSANSIDASYYNGDMRPLAVQGIDAKGRPFGVTASDLAQWGMVQTRSDSSRPSYVVPQPQRSQ